MRPQRSANVILDRAYGRRPGQSAGAADGTWRGHRTGCRLSGSDRLRPRLSKRLSRQGFNAVGMKMSGLLGIPIYD